MYSLINSTSSSIESINISQIYKEVKLNSADPGGYGFIYVKGKVTLRTPLVPVKVVVPQDTYISTESTYGAIGADKLYLLSHLSQIPGKSKINFDNTLYGIDTKKFADDIEPNTSSMVRGEELLELISLIVRFLVSHTHAYPGLPPVNVTQDGSNVANILTEMQNAYTKILNENIRLN
jgi:hypothetical protein